MPPMSLYLLIGQSNMAGRGRHDEASSPPDPRILVWTRAGTWAQARDPLHYDKPEAGVGPGLAFAASMAGEDAKARIGLIPAAVGGTSISLWKQGVQDPVTHAFPYDDAVRRTRQAMPSGILKAILWHQGEADRGIGSRETYAACLIELVAHLRSDLHAHDIPFIAGELPQLDPERAVDTAAFNAILAGLRGCIPRFGLVSAKDLRDGGDLLHLDSASARELGRRYATALYEIYDGR